MKRKRRPTRSDKGNVVGQGDLEVTISYSGVLLFTTLEIDLALQKDFLLLQPSTVKLLTRYSWNKKKGQKFDTHKTWRFVISLAESV